MKCILMFPTKKSQNWPDKIKTSAYFTLVRPQLEYATAIWDPYTQYARYVCSNYNCEASVSTMMAQPPTKENRHPPCHVL